MANNTGPPGVGRNPLISNPPPPPAPGRATVLLIVQRRRPQSAARRLRFPWFQSQSGRLHIAAPHPPASGPRRPGESPNGYECLRAADHRRAYRVRRARHRSTPCASAPGTVIHCRIIQRVNAVSQHNSRAIGSRQFTCILECSFDWLPRSVATTMVFMPVAKLMVVSWRLR